MNAILLLKSLLIEFNKKLYISDNGELYFKHSDIYEIVMRKIKELEEERDEMS